MGQTEQKQINRHEGGLFVLVRLSGLLSRALSYQRNASTIQCSHLGLLYTQCQVRGRV